MSLEVFVFKNHFCMMLENSSKYIFLLASVLNEEVYDINRFIICERENCTDEFILITEVKHKLPLWSCRFSNVFLLKANIFFSASSLTPSSKRSNPCFPRLSLHGLFPYTLSWWGFIVSIFFFSEADSHKGSFFWKFY